MDFNRILLAGDFGADRFYYGQHDHRRRFRINSYIETPGRASNVARHLAYLNKKKYSVHNFPKLIPSCGSNIHFIYSRYIDLSTTKKVFETDSVTFSIPVYGETIDVHHYSRKPYLLLISSYGKNSVEEQLTNIVSYLKTATVVVIDARYRDIDIQYWSNKLSSDTVLVWHATDKEYDSNYVRQFDYTVHTNHNQPVSILDKHGRILHTYDVENINHLAIGAGDAFTAKLAHILAKYVNEPKNIDSYVVFAAAIQASDYVTKCIKHSDYNYITIPSHLQDDTKYDVYDTTSIITPRSNRDTQAQTRRLFSIKKDYHSW